MKKFRHNGAAIPNLKGVRVEGDAVLFPDSYSDQEIAAIRKRIAQGGRRELQTQNRKAYTPTESESAAILAAMPGVKDLTGFGFYEAVAAESLLDRDRDILTKSFLQILADRYANGRAIVDSHNTRQRIGYTFGAEVKDHPDQPGESQLLVRFYVDPQAKMSGGNNAKREIDTGLVRRVSVSFSSPEIKFVGEDESEMGYHWIYDAPEHNDSGKVEVFELSVVAMGAQAGAHIKGEKGGIAKSPTFGSSEIKQDNSNKPDKPGMEKYMINKTGKEIEASPEVIAEIKHLEKMLADREAELKPYVEAAEKAKKELAGKLVNLKKAINPELEIDAEAEVKKYMLWTPDQITAELKSYEGISKIKQLDPGKKPKGEEGNKVKTGTAFDYVS